MRVLTEKLVAKEMQMLDMELALLSSIYHSSGVQATIRIVNIDAKFLEPSKVDL